ncbi:hypothetical protein FIBSPDRAFT_903167 [Athelia psychrophila]|uniref:MYND-type domain-containing protein n=1 Tax=Athelia psychrophila TaxID=1759441 RepID=A0A167WBW9_9AGAM|nr:hypothetical protein FIBSPDRAFT_903167 [Fibularhizoctonia sp. CBS 109695]
MGLVSHLQNHPEILLESTISSAMIPRPTRPVAPSGIVHARKQIQQFSERVSRSLEPPIAKIQTILQKYLSITALPVIRPSPTVQDWSTVDLGIHTFQVIAACAPHLLKAPELDTCLLNAWPGMWRWLQFLSDQCCQSTMYGRVTHVQAISAIASTVETLALSEAICRVMVSTPGVIAMMTRYWMAEGENPITAGQPRVGRICGRALDSLISTHERPPHSLPHVVAAALGGAEAVTKHALGQLDAAQALKQPNFLVVCENLSLIGNLNRTTAANIQLSFLEQGFMPKMPTATPEDEEMACRCVSECLLTSLRNMMLGLRDRSWVIQALDSGIIPAILKSAPRLAQLEEQEAFTCSALLSEDLCPYLVCRSVVRSTARALKVAERLDLDCLAGPIMDAWMVFKNLAQERIALEAMGDEFDAESQRSSKGCSRMHCRMAVDDLQRCTGCRSVFYCNRACQKIDWMTHRPMCHSVQRQYPDGISSSLTVGDFRFIRKIISNDIRKNAELLKTLLDDALSQFPPLEVAINLDYLQVPVEMRVMSVRDFNEPGENCDWRRLIEDSASQRNGRMLVVRAQVHEGAAIWVQPYPVLPPEDWKLFTTI